MPFYQYTVVPVGPVSEISGEPVKEQTLVSEDRWEVGDVVPASPGTWTVERVAAAGTTQWASEAVGRVNPQTVTSHTLYCRVDP